VLLADSASTWTGAWVVEVAVATVVVVAFSTVVLPTTTVVVGAIVVGATVVVGAQVVSEGEACVQSSVAPAALMKGMKEAPASNAPPARSRKRPPR
jgi:hypothetical protein